jgi:glycosyltransferase involved in cell wall biosynthesis
MSRILLVSHNAIGENLSGPGMRYWEFANYLGREHQVTLLVPSGEMTSHPRAEVKPFSPSLFARLAQDVDVVVSQGFEGYSAFQIAFLDTPQVFDLYCPIPFETLEVYRSAGDTSFGPTHLAYIRNRFNLLFRRGDFFLCASEEQRHLWLGALFDAGRITLREYLDDAQLRNLIDVVPLGVPTEPPKKQRRVLRGVYPGFAEDDFILLWLGGVWNWLDPLILIQAMARLTRGYPRIKLLFLAGNSPPPTTPRGHGLAEAIAESKHLGLYERQVFFHLQQIPYAERGEYLLEADAGVVFYRNNLETEFAFRTRLVDYFWAGLPVLCARGDSLSRLVEQHTAGLTVSPQRVEEVEQAIVRLAEDSAFRRRCQQGSRQIAGTMLWQNILRPLDSFCRFPRRAVGLHAFPYKVEALADYMLSNARALVAHPTAAVLRQAARKLRGV